LNPAWKTGDLALFYDHIAIPSLAGLNALRGPNAAEFGPRFPALSGCYPVELRRLAVEAAKDAGIPLEWLHEGVYCFVGGPSYETPAEARALRMLGGDMVGMSTVPEVITAVHCGLKILAISLITNRVPTARGEMALPNDPTLRQVEVYEDPNIPAPTHEEVLAISAARSLDVERWFKFILKRL
jgi:purine-nucleoside phosphorylase